MPWQPVSTMDQKIQFVRDYNRRTFPTMTELCAHYEIARKTGYKFVQRFEAEGRPGLAEKSRRPDGCPWATPEDQIDDIVALRTRHSSWGARKLVTVLKKRHPETAWAAPSTVSLILKREGLVTSRPRRSAAPTRPRVEQVVAAAPNHVWSADFKGHFRTGDGRYCYPLTVMDRFSRYLLDCHGMLAPDEDGTRRRFEHLFRLFGLPTILRTDNGAPFASTGLAGLSHLSVWWMRLGILLDRIRPAHPEENGSHERFHRTLKRDTARPPAGSCAAQQRRFHTFRPEYNYVRPHEALGQIPPGEVYAPSGRPMPAALPPIEYPGHFEVRRVGPSGNFSWSGVPVFATHVLRGQDLGFEEIDDGLWSVYFCAQRIARFDERTKRIEGTHKRRTPPSTAASADPQGS
jgi:putative transposase